MNELDEKLQEYLIATSVKILKRDEDEIIWEDDIDEYGYASMEVNQLCVALNETFSIDTQPAIFLEVTSLEELSQYLKKKYFSKLEDKLL